MTKREILKQKELHIYSMKIEKRKEYRDMATIATHNGSIVHQEHNVRNRNVTDKEPHIKKDGVYEVWRHEKVRDAYHRLFDEAKERYNQKQQRADRKIEDYYTQVKKSKIQHPCYEMIIGVYPSKDDYITKEKQRDILHEFVSSWEERNPNLEMIGAYYHADEQGEPHVHIDYIPIAHGYTRGMETQAGLVKALGAMGFEKQGKDTAQIQWEHKQNEYLEELCIKRGIQVEHPMNQKEHKTTEEYKLEKSIETKTYTLDQLEDEYQEKLQRNLAVPEQKHSLFQKKDTVEVDRETYTYLCNVTNNLKSSLEKEKRINDQLKELDAKNAKLDSILAEKTRALQNMAYSILKRFFKEKEKQIEEVTQAFIDGQQYKAHMQPTMQTIKQEAKAIVQSLSDIELE